MPLHHAADGTVEREEGEKCSDRQPYITEQQRKDRLQKRHDGKRKPDAPDLVIGL